MNRNKLLSIIGIVVGILLFIIGICLHSEETKALSGVALGIGAGLFGASLSNLLSIRWMDKRPTIKKQNEIEFKDERNTAIRNRAKAKASDITQWLIMGVAYITILIEAPLWVTAVTVGVFLFHHILTLAFINKYQKEM